MKNLRNKNQPPPTTTIQRYLSTSWDIVQTIYGNMDLLVELATALGNGDLDDFLTAADIDTLAELNLILNDATLGDFASQAQAEAGTDNTTTMTPLRVAQAIAVLAAGLQNNYSGTVPPGATDDSVAGYSVGSFWIDTTASPNESYRCSDNTASAAVWLKTTLTSDELATVGLTGDSDDLIEGVTQLLLTVSERSVIAAVDQVYTAAEKAKLAGIETAATADQSDGEIETAYNNQVGIVSQADAEAGVSTVRKGWTSLRVAQAIAALGVNDFVPLTGATMQGDILGDTGISLGGSADRFWNVWAQNGYYLNYVFVGTDASDWMTIDKNTISGSRATGFTFSIDGKNADEVTTNLLIRGQAAYANAVTNIVGGDVEVRGGQGSLNAAGNAHGGQLYLEGGPPEGTGDDGDVHVGNTQGNLKIHNELLLVERAISALPAAAGAAGYMTSVNDALAPVNGSTVAAGGAVACVVYSDGTNWIVVTGGTTAAGGGGGGLTVEFKSASFTAVEGKKYKVRTDLAVSDVIVTLPAGVDLDNIVIQDVGHNAVNNNIIVNPNGTETIDSDVEFIIDQNEGDIDIGYNNSTSNWEVSSDGSPNLVSGVVKSRTVRTLIETINLSTAGHFDFDTIPSGYDRLIIKGYIRGDIAADNDGMSLFINADLTATNYHSQYNLGGNGAALVSEGANALCALIPGSTSPSGSYGTIESVIENPDSANLKMATTTCQYYRATDSMYSGVVGTVSAITAAITRLRFMCDGDPTDELTGELFLYGEKDEEIGGGSGINPLGTTKTRTVRTAIEVIDNSATAGSFNFQNIPADYDRLIIQGSIRGDVSADLDQAMLYINGDETDANYLFQTNAGYNNGSIAVEGAQGLMANIPGGTGLADSFCDINTKIEGYTSSHIKNYLCDFIGYRSTGNLYAGQFGVASAITAAITQLHVMTDNNPTDELFGVLTLYGEKDEEIGGGGSGSGLRRHIETIENTVAGEFDFAVPVGYSRLILKGHVRSDVAATTDGLQVYLNEDLTAANYHCQRIAGSNNVAIATEGAFPLVAICSAASGPANDYTEITVEIEAPDSTYIKKMQSQFVTTDTTTSLYAGSFGVRSALTAGVVRIRVRTDNHATDLLLGKLSLYGEVE